MKFLRSATSANLAVKGLGKFPCGKLCSSITKLKSKIQVFFKAILIQFAKKKKKKPLNSTSHLTILPKDYCTIFAERKGSSSSNSLLLVQRWKVFFFTKSCQLLVDHNPCNGVLRLTVWDGIFVFWNVFHVWINHSLPSMQYLLFSQPSFKHHQKTCEGTVEERQQTKLQGLLQTPKENADGCLTQHFTAKMFY